MTSRERAERVERYIRRMSSDVGTFILDLDDAWHEYALLVRSRTGTIPRGYRTPGSFRAMNEQEFSLRDMVDDAWGWVNARAE